MKTSNQNPYPLIRINVLYIVIAYPLGEFNPHIKDLDLDKVNVGNLGHSP